MTRIRLHRLGSDLRHLPAEIHEAASLAEWLMATYPAGVARQPLEVYAGEPSGDTRVPWDPDVLLRAAAPEYVVVETPGTGPEAIAAGKLLFSMVVSAALNYMLAPSVKPIANRAQESPNNQLSNRENQVRILQRVESVYGKVRSIPSVMMPPYRKYLQHRAVEYGLYCATEGYADVTDVCDGDTPVAGIDGSSAAVYAPFTSPNSGDAPQLQIGEPIIDTILTVQRSSSVDGITLKAANQTQITPGQTYYFYSEGAAVAGIVPAHTRDLIYQGVDARVPNFAAVAEAGQNVTIEMEPQEVTRFAESVLFTVDGTTNTYTCDKAGYFRGTVIGSTAVVSGFAGAANNGDMTVVAWDEYSLTVAESLVDEGIGNAKTFELLVDYSGARVIHSVSNGWIQLTGAPQISTMDYPLNGGSGPTPGYPYGEGVVADIEVDNGLTDWTGWFTLSATDRTEVWTNVLAQNGLYKESGGRSSVTVAYEMQIERLTSLLAPTGDVETVTGSLRGATSNERAETLERVTAWAGPVRVRMRRTTPFDYRYAGFVNDEIKWVDLYSVSPVTKPHFGNKTIIHTVTLATVRATTARRRELNCLVARRIPTFDGTSFSGAFDAEGRHVSGTIHPTSKVMDILAAVTVDRTIGNRSIAELDMAQIRSVQLALDAWNPECGQFNYTFDSDAISYEETVNAIANAAFCTAYRQNGRVRLSLDRPQAVSTALFTHRNKQPSKPGSAAEVITRKFASDAEYDGVEFLYDDPDTEAKETIRLPQDGNYTKLKKIEIPGIRSYAQAWIRANREYNQLRWQRLFIETVTTADARALLPNTRVDIVDNTRFKSYDGEVVAQDGLTLTLSREVAFTPSVPHSIVLMRRDGSTQSIACSEVADAPNQVLLAGVPDEALVTEPSPEDGIRTIFSFAADSARGAMAWLVKELRPKGQYIQIVAVNYTDAYYAADEEPIPDKSGVIYD